MVDGLLNRHYLMSEACKRPLLFWASLAKDAVLGNTVAVMLGSAFLVVSV